MRTVGVIQARVGSTRLPAKVLAEVGGATMLERVVSRAGRAATLDEVVVAIPDGVTDDCLVEVCARIGVTAVRGSEDDVLDRYLAAASTTSADVVVRITSDCPLVDSQVVDEVVRTFHGHRPDYAANTLRRCWPRGLDVEAVDRGALETAGREAREPYERVHVTPYLYRHPERFRLLPVVGPFQYGDLRWTVDTADDLAMVREIYAAFGNDDSFGWREVLDLLSRRPEIAAINRGVAQKKLELG